MTRYEERSRRYFEWGGCEKSASISVKRTFNAMKKRGRTGFSSSSLVESLASRPTQLLLARTDLNCQGRHPLPRSSSVLMSDGENLAAIWVFAAESGTLAGRGRRPSTEYDAHLEISSRTIVWRVLLGSTVDQVSAVSPALCSSRAVELPRPPLPPSCEPGKEATPRGVRISAGVMARGARFERPQTLRGRKCPELSCVRVVSCPNVGRSAL